MGKEKLLRIEAPYFVAGAVWTKQERWECTRAAPIIKWMVGKTPDEVKKYLDKKGWEYSFL